MSLRNEIRKYIFSESQNKIEPVRVSIGEYTVMVKPITVGAMQRLAQAATKEDHARVMFEILKDSVHDPDTNEPIFEASDFESFLNLRMTPEIQALMRVINEMSVFDVEEGGKD